MGNAIAGMLQRIGIVNPQDLIGKDPVILYEQLCEVTGKRTDPCVLDVFISVVRFMEGGAALPWWSFTAERKRLNSGKQ